MFVNETNFEVTKQLEQRFWNKVQKTKSCWLWTGSTSRGYGEIRINGINLKVHRVVFKLIGRDLNSKDIVCHSCDIRNCVNPDHLIVGTQSYNLQDSYNKNRRVCTMEHLKGDKHPLSKLNWDKVNQIRISKLSQRKIAKKFNISRSVVVNIQRNNTWKI